MIDQWDKVTNEPLKDKCFSGMIYSNSLNDGEKKMEDVNTGEVAETRTMETPDDFSALSKNLQFLYQYSFSKSYLWNSLHLTEFSVGYYVTYQLVCMVARMFGGDIHNVSGFVTPGGTGSIMLACRSY